MGRLDRWMDIVECQGNLVKWSCGCQADLNCNIQEETGAFYGVSSQYESSENMTITCSTKVCSFGKQVVEKVEVRTSPNLGATLRQTNQK